MTVEIKLSDIGGQEELFAEAVEKHITKLHAFNKTIGQPRPTASPLIEMAVKRVQEDKKPDTYVADYKIIAPPTPPPLSLEDRKNQIHMRLSMAESAAKDKILPPRKKRLLSALYDQGIFKKEEDRTVEDKENISNFLAVNKQWMDISLIAARVEATIDDLTEADIEAWQPPDFG